MKTTLPDDLAHRRRELAQAPVLARLAQRLGRLIDPLVHGPLYLPEEKALLSREGGVCASDGARLAFDPMSPHEHRCPACGAAHTSERHHRAWIWRYHLWLSERAIHLALLGALEDEPRFTARAWEILERYADLYPRAPNKDNVLGPTRLFFSTYLESIWLTQVAIAALMLDSLAGHRSPRTAHRGRVDAMIAESARLIASFDEGRSNRQAWNATALLAAGVWLDDAGLRDAALTGPHGLLEAHRAGVTASGMWYEGENYHFFALRGFVLGAELARWVGAELPSLRAMHEAPLDTLLPDLTLPARGDSPYGASVAQPRFADLWEVGWARTGSERVEALLTTLYALDLPPGADPGFAEIAEQEVNRSPTRLVRDGLSWKALLWMRPEEPRAAPYAPAPTRLLEDAGIVVLRPSPAAYVSVEGGGARGGHGHPDLLHLSVYLGRSLLADLGTGSYVNPSLHWYRSALAHNAPALAGEGQLECDGWCAALDARDGWTWCQSEARDVCGRGTSARRSVVACAGWVLDVVDVHVPADVAVDLPVHPLTAVAATVVANHGGASGASSHRGAGHESGYDRVRWMGISEPDAVRVEGMALAPRNSETLLVGEAAGPPTLWFADGAPVKFLVRRASGAGMWAMALFAGPHGRIRAEGGEIVVDAEASYRIQIESCAARIRLPDGQAVRLAGARRPRSVTPSRPAAVPFSGVVLRCPRLDTVPPPSAWAARVPTVTLDRAAYRRAEDEYGARGPFLARVGAFAVGSRLCFGVSVVKADLTFRPAEAFGAALDNETPDIHSDGVQCYVGSGAWRGWVLVPRPGAGVHVRAVAGTAATAGEVHAQWERTSDGYHMVIEIAIAHELVEGERLPVNVVVNEMYPDRERRAGQLALSGGGGWVYLRGDREAPAWSASLEVV